VFTQEKITMTKNCVRYHYVEQRLIYLIDAYGNISERDLSRKITPQYNS